MRGIIISAIFVLAAAGSGLSQSILKCDVTILLETSKKTGSLSQSNIFRFLHTFGQECRTDVEYSEWSNELLFSVLNRQTQATLIVLYKKERSLDIEEIIHSMSSPLNDFVGIDSLIVKVEGTNPANPMRGKVLEALMIAKAK
jgi:hypothetical protein